MKEVAKRLLRSMAVRLPFGASVTLLDALSHRHGTNHAWLIRQAAQAKIAGFLVDGEWGLIQSAVDDKMILPIYARTGTWARRTNLELIAFFKGRSGTYIDIGANIGLTTIPVAQNAQVRCIAFEPDPTNYQNLQQNLRRNIFGQNVTTHQTALFDRETSVDFGLAEDGNLGDHRIVQQSNVRRRTIKVKAKPLDSLIENIAEPLAVKIDVQGVEPNVIRGGKAVLAHAEFVILEFSPFLMTQFGSDYRTTIEFLRGFSQIAALLGEDDGPLGYEPSDQVCSRLEQYYLSAANDEYKFMDIYARR
jgi:FkbM family methyltransferase